MKVGISSYIIITSTDGYDASDTNSDNDSQNDNADNDGDSDDDDDIII